MGCGTMSDIPHLIIIPANTPKDKEDTEPNQRLRVAAYCRVSTSDAEQLISYEAQKSYYTDKIMTNPEWLMAGIFADEGITGTSAQKRPEFMKMIRRCRKGQIDLILTKSISRFARNTVDCLNYIRELKELGIAVLFEKENINTLESDSEIIITMMGAFAQSESESISQNIRWGQQQAMKEGRVNFKYKQTYGYERGEDDRPKIVPEQAQVVRRIFDAYLSGMSCDAIKDMLESEGIPSAKGTPVWRTGVLYRMLENEKYAGDVLMQKTYVKDCLTKKAVKNNGELPKYLIQNYHEGIVSRDIFNHVQAERARRSSLTTASDNGSDGSSKYSGKFALAGIMFCGECGKPYKRRTWAKNGKNKIMWRCSNRLVNGTKYCKESPSIEEGALQAAILRALNDHYGAEHVAVRPIVAQIVPQPYFKERAEQLKQSVSVLLFLAATGQQIGYEQQMGFVEKMIHDFKDSHFSTNVEISTETVDITHLEINSWDESEIRKLVNDVVVMEEPEVKLTFADGVERVVQF